MYGLEHRHDVPGRDVRQNIVNLLEHKSPLRRKDAHLFAHVPGDFLRGSPHQNLPRIAPASPKRQLPPTSELAASSLARCQSFAWRGLKNSRYMAGEI